MFDQQRPFVGLGCHLVDGHRALPLHGGGVILIIAAVDHGAVGDGVGKSETTSKCDIRGPFQLKRLASTQSHPRQRMDEYGLTDCTYLCSTHATV